MLKALVHEYLPPKVARGMDAVALALFRKGIVYWGPVPLPASLFNGAARKDDPGAQNLDVYWSDEMAKALETWGEGTTWREILFFLSLARGRPPLRVPPVAVSRRGVRVRALDARLPAGPRLRRRGA